MQLTDLEFMIGLFSLLITIISVYVGLYIASKYFKSRIKSFLLVGISWTGLMNGWWPSALSFLSVLITNQSLPPIPYFLIGNLVLPWFLLIWIMAFNDFLSIQRKNIVLVVFILFALLYDGLLLYNIFTTPANIGELTNAVDVQYKGIISLLLLLVLIIVCITGLLFAKHSLKSEQKVSKLRGKFIAIAFISWTVGAIADSAFTLNFITLPIVRILLISSSIEFYIGIIMPKPIKKIFVKK
ncbi:MAG: hypothetical protein ACOC4M_11260 [Promethearchaeia archaeon]